MSRCMKKNWYALAPKCQVLLLAKGLGLILLSPEYEYGCKSVHVQDATAQLQSQLADTKTRLEHQESETRKADSKFQFSLTEIEKLKTNFDTERTAWAEERTALIQRAQKAESALQEVTTELTS